MMEQSHNASMGGRLVPHRRRGLHKLGELRLYMSSKVPGTPPSLFPVSVCDFRSRSSSRLQELDLGFTH